jgi:hypothetical protein
MRSSYVALGIDVVACYDYEARYEECNKNFNSCVGHNERCFEWDLGSNPATNTRSNNDSIYTTTKITSLSCHVFTDGLEILSEGFLFTRISRRLSDEYPPLNILLISLVSVKKIHTRKRPREE